MSGPKRKLWHTVTSLLKVSKVNPITLMNQNGGVHGLNLARLFDERELLQDGLHELVGRASRGEITPTIAQTFPLTAKGAADAHTYLHDRRNIGKVVLVRAG